MCSCVFVCMCICVHLVTHEEICTHAIFTMKTSVKQASNIKVYLFSGQQFFLYDEHEYSQMLYIFCTHPRLYVHNRSDLTPSQFEWCRTPVAWLKSNRIVGDQVMYPVVHRPTVLRFSYSSLSVREFGGLVGSHFL